MRNESSSCSFIPRHGYFTTHVLADAQFTRESWTDPSLAHHHVQRLAQRCAGRIWLIRCSGWVGVLVRIINVDTCPMVHLAFRALVTMPGSIACGTVPPHLLNCEISTGVNSSSHVPAASANQRLISAQSRNRLTLSAAPINRTIGVIVLFGNGSRGRWGSTPARWIRPCSQPDRLNQASSRCGAGNPDLLQVAIIPVGDAERCGACDAWTECGSSVQHRRSLYDTSLEEAVFVSLCIHGQGVIRPMFGPSGVSMDIRDRSEWVPSRTETCAFTVGPGLAAECRYDVCA